MDSQPTEIDDSIIAVRGWVAEALLQLDDALKSRHKHDKRRLLLSAGAVLHGVVGELEQLLKTEPPRA